MNVEVGGAWGLETSGELCRWQGVPGVYRIGDAGLLDLTGVSEALRVWENGAYLGAEQMAIEFADGTALTITVHGVVGV